MIRAAARFVRRARRLTAKEIFLFAEAAALLTLAGLALRLLPFRRLARRLGRWTQATPDDPAAAAAPAEIAAVSRAVARARRRLPWRPACLAQAVAGSVMLGRRGVSSTIHFGVDNAGGFRAHAWLTAAGRGVTGGDVAPTFKPIARVDCGGR